MENLILELSKLQKEKEALIEANFEIRETFNNVYLSLKELVKSDKFINELKKFFNIENDYFSFAFVEHKLNINIYFLGAEKQINILNVIEFENFLNGFQEEIKKEIEILKNEIKILKGI